VSHIHRRHFLLAVTAALVVRRWLTEVYRRFTHRHDWEVYCRLETTILLRCTTCGYVEPGFGP
jgi:hypothetical protein